MIVIDYDPSLQVPAIKESDIDDKIILSIFRDSNIYMATKISNNTVVWRGCGLYEGARLHIMSRTLTYSLINLLINDWKECSDNVVFYVLENNKDIINIIEKYSVQKYPDILTMLNTRAFTR